MSKKLNILSVETSTVQGGVALLKNSEFFSEKISARQRSHAEVVHVYIEEILRDAALSAQQLDALAVSVGPGSFTGVRVAVNTISSLAFAIKKPVLVFDSLSVLGFENKSKKTSLVLQNAFRGELYCGIYKWHEEKFQQITPSFVKAPQLLELDFDQEYDVLGDGFEIFEPYVSIENKKKFNNQKSLYPSPRILAEMGLAKMCGNLDIGQVLTAEDVRPLYLRASEPEEKARTF